jgi:hypothetical protein
MLNPKRNWRFSREVAPFSLYAKAPVDLRDYYFNPVAVQENGDPVPVDADGDPLDSQPCTSRLAYFQALGESAHEAQGQDNADRFNLHVEIVDPQDPTGKRCIPIIIDPDVGHPGGHEP